MFARKFVKSERFLAVLREHIILNVKWVEFRKMNVFLSETALKMCGFSARKSEIKKSSDDVHWNA